MLKKNALTIQHMFIKNYHVSCVKDLTGLLWPTLVINETIGSSLRWLHISLLAKYTVPAFNFYTKCVGSSSIIPLTQLPHSFLAMDAWMTSQLNLA